MIQNQPQNQPSENKQSGLEQSGPVAAASFTELQHEMMTAVEELEAGETMVVMPVIEGLMQEIEAEQFVAEKNQREEILIRLDQMIELLTEIRDNTRPRD